MIVCPQMRVYSARNLNNAVIPLTQKRQQGVGPNMHCHDNDELYFLR
jgi:hypothetical protein